MAAALIAELEIQARDEFCWCFFSGNKGPAKGCQWQGMRSAAVVIVLIIVRKKAS